MPRKLRRPRRGVAVQPAKARRRPAGSDSDAAELIIVSNLEDLDEIVRWLATFRERLMVADGEQRARIFTIVEQLELHYRQRRAELS